MGKVPVRSVLRLEQAADIIQDHAKEFGFKENQSLWADHLVRGLDLVPDVDTGEMTIPIDKFSGFYKNFSKALMENDSAFIYQERGLAVNRIVDVEEFTESPDYMNQKGFIRPVIKYELDRLFKSDTYVEAVLTGAIGIGKNYFADMAVSYMLYLLSVFKNPQVEHDLAPGSSIIFIMQSLSLTLAKKVVFDQFSERLKLSPYFKNHFPFDLGIKSELRFPKNIYVLPIGGSDTGAIGMNVYGGVIDELNFMARVEDSVNIKHTQEAEYDQAERLYTSIIRRMKSRFIQKEGKLPGKLLLVSSVNYPGDFTDKKIEESKTDKTIFIMKYSQWEALPKDKFCGEVFHVEVGNDFKQSRILNSVEEAIDPEDVLPVPVEYKTEFERDLDAALRDLAGTAIGTKHPFIPYRESLKKAQDDYQLQFEGNSLFTVETCVLSNILDVTHDGALPDWDNLINHDYIENYVIDPTQPYASHIDVGITNDAAGLAVGHISGYKLLPAFKYFNEKTGGFVEVRDVRAPIYTMDGILQVTAPPNGEVDLELLKDLILYLKGIFNIKWGTSDSYQSALIIQAFRKARIRSGVLSVDTSIAPYSELKQSIKDERILMPAHKICSKEIIEIEHDTKKGKIDHPTGGTKDCSDACSGVCYMLQQKEASFGLASGSNRRRRKSGVRSDVRAIRTRRNKSRIKNR